MKTKKLEMIREPIETDLLEHPVTNLQNSLPCIDEFLYENLDRAIKKLQIIKQSAKNAGYTNIKICIESKWPVDIYLEGTRKETKELATQRVAEEIEYIAYTLTEDEKRLTLLKKRIDTSEKELAKLEKEVKQ